MEAEDEEVTGGVVEGGAGVNAVVGGMVANGPATAPAAENENENEDEDDEDDGEDEEEDEEEEEEDEDEDFDEDEDEEELDYSFESEDEDEEATALHIANLLQTEERKKLLTRQLLAAIQAGDVAGAQRAVQDGADVSDRSGVLQRELRRACRKADVSAVATLIAAGVDVDLSMFTALDAAISFGRMPIMEGMLMAGMGENVTLAPEDEYARLVVIDHILYASKDASRATDYALFHACKHGRLPIVVHLVAAGANVHARYDDKPVLEAACRRGNEKIVEILLAAGAQPNVQGYGAFGVACAIDAVGIVKRLLDAGADFDRNNSNDLCFSARQGHHDIVEMLLAAGANVHSSDDEALREASKFGRDRVVAQLLAAGANVHAKDDEALRAACHEGRTETVRLLLAAGANVHANDDEALRRGSNRMTPDIAISLLQAGGDVSAIDRHWSWGPLTCGYILAGVHRDRFLELSPKLRALWLRLVLRPRMRLARALQRARARLDRPPTVPLGVTTPTREALIAHLQTAGRRFAREYWLEGLPIFFPSLDLGPVPDCFVAPVMGDEPDGGENA